MDLGSVTGDPAEELARIIRYWGCLDPDDRHLASAAEEANAFLSAAGQRKQARRSGPSARGL